MVPQLPGRVLAVLFVVDLMLVAVFLLCEWLHVPWYRLTQRFHFEAEGNLPNWWAGVKWFMVAQVAGLQALCGAGGRRVWVAIAVGALVFSVDEVACFHEQIGMTLIDRKSDVVGALGAQRLDLIAYALYALAALVGLCIARRDVPAFLRDGRGLRALLAGAVLLVLGGVLVDTFLPHIREALPLALEEGLEMAGASLLLYGVLSRSPLTAAPTARAVAGVAPAV